MAVTNEMSEKQSDFPTTNWGTVIHAGGTNTAEAAPALEGLCKTYWYPLYAFVRRKGNDVHAAEDLTQSFFAHLFEKDGLKSVREAKGKFRSFLLASLTNFLANEWDKKQTQKRGGTRQIISWDEVNGEELYRHEPADHLTPQRLFERRWAWVLVEGVNGRLKDEYAETGKVDLFVKLQPFLTREIETGLYADIGLELGMNEGALKVALHRLRKRFRDLLRREIAHTVSEPDQIEEEIRSLFAAIAE